MFRLVLLISLGVVAYGRPESGCIMSKWSDWKGCTTSDNPSVQYPNTEPEVWDEGRLRFEEGMIWKEQQRMEIDQCRAEGTCPEFDFRKSLGPHPCVGGDAGGYPCHNVDLEHFLDFNDLGYDHVAPPRGNDIWGYTSSSGEEYAIVGMNAGTSMVRVTNPKNPQVLGWLETHTSASSWRDIKVIDDHAYIVSEAGSHGMQVFDLSALDALSEDKDRKLQVSNYYGGFGQAHNIVANEATHKVFGVGSTQGGGVCSGGLYILDVSDPDNIVFVACYGGDGYVHDAECVVYDGPDTEYTGHEICFCYNENTFTIVDITDTNNVVMLSRKSYEGVRYTHQGWLTEDSRTVLLNDEQDELRDPDGNGGRTRTYMWDVRDLDDPLHVTIYRASVTSIDHNLYIRNKYAYMSNYESGLRVTHIDDDDMSNLDMTEVAYFDCLPGSTNVNFAGTWSNFPFFDHEGLVALDSIDYGLFMLQVDLDAAQREVEAVKAGKEYRYRDVLKAFGDAECPPVFETRNRQC